MFLSASTEKYDKLESECDPLHYDIKSIKDENQLLKVRIETLENDKAALQAEITILRDKYKAQYNTDAFSDLMQRSHHS